jgi:alpha-glucosidase (family GH31 glycosyl hydrolase)
MLASSLIHFEPLAEPDAIVVGPHVRFTVLTECLIRMEYSKGQSIDGIDQFEDHPSQVFWYRKQPVPIFVQRVTENSIEIETSALLLKYKISRKGFSAANLSIKVKSTGKTWRFGDSPQSGGNLGGTNRTLDEVFEDIELDSGLMGRSGWALVDDSHTLVFDETGWLHPRQKSGSLDLYFFGYGLDYKTCLKDFGRIAGNTPLIPRWILGNWWSRYWEYSADELLALMTEFKDHDVPLSICIIDMDWHITETGNDSNGWTGYTWNRKLFPDPGALVARLHEMGLKTALNLHPAAGIWPHEQQYREFALQMGIDPESKNPIEFDSTDSKFIEAYFKLLHHPIEEQGVDFWWLDWQQGNESKIQGLDPLWWLNHLHFYDLGRDGKKRPFIFSRWGGLGNHRYPIGFSGDTVINWEVLNILPSFTSTAANVGYGWWSHDIGGHMGGIENDELFTRWVQFGLFSPILRLHSTKNPFHERRPWKRGGEAERAVIEVMRLRHAFIPYLYSMAWRNFNQNLPLILPMYYSHPEDQAAYQVPQQYWCGSELIAAPFTKPTEQDTQLSEQIVWLPDGEWYDFCSGEYFPGNRWHRIFGTLEDIPVFAKAGAIVPLDNEIEWGGVKNPVCLRLNIYPGANNTFELFEDDGETTKYLRMEYVITKFIQEWQTDQITFRILHESANPSLKPSGRIYHLNFLGINRPTKISILVNGMNNSTKTRYDGNRKVLSIDGLRLETDQVLMVELSAPELLAHPKFTQEKLFKFLSGFRLDSWTKANIFNRWKSILEGEDKLQDWDITERQIKVLESLI